MCPCEFSWLVPRLVGTTICTQIWFKTSWIPPGCRSLGWFKLHPDWLVGRVDGPCLPEDCQLVTELHGTWKNAFGGVATDRKRLGVEVESMEVYGPNDICYIMMDVLEIFFLNIISDEAPWKIADSSKNFFIFPTFFVMSVPCDLVYVFWGFKTSRNFPVILKRPEVTGYLWTFEFSDSSETWEWTEGSHQIVAPSRGQWSHPKTPKSNESSPPVHLSSRSHMRNQWMVGGFRLVVDNPRNPWIQKKGITGRYA